MFGLIFANCFMMKYEKRVNQSTAESQQIEAYLKLLQTYAETGQCLSVENSYSLVSLKALTDEETLFSFSYSHEALLVYLQQIMTDDFVRSRVADNQILQRVFVDTMIQFVTQNLQKAQYQLQRTRAEINALCEAYEWSIVRRQQGWENLLFQVEDKYSRQGFDSSFYRHEFEQHTKYVEEAMWSNFLEEWNYQIKLKLAEGQRQFLAERAANHAKLLHTNLQGVSDYVTSHHIQTADFLQVWALMGGRWNTLEFERLYRVALLQRKHSELVKVVERMGRTTQTDGVQYLTVASGVEEKLNSAAKSDIEGITIGQNFNALLPIELAQFLDVDMENVFLTKYVAGRLQVFDYQSRMLRSARSLTHQQAVPKGPVIVCVDCSGSMYGEPRQIAQSLMMRVSELCYAQHRECYLIAFSVHARPIDVLRNRTQLLQFFSQPSVGNTNACEMLDTTFTLLRSGGRHSGADVLWVTDFRIPLPPVTYLQSIRQFRQQGTRFYGLQIGIAENRWLSHFDEIFNIPQVKMSK